MSAGKEAGVTETIEWFVEPAQGVPGAGAAANAAAADHVRARRDEKRANSVGVAITTSLLFVLLMAAILVGGHAAIAPLLGRAVAVRDSKGVGDVVYTMPDGVFCRHMSFNNTTAEVTESGVEPCPDRIGAGSRPSSTRFEWGGH
ncbi:MAG TPA: hypothetical protein VMF12_09900 [Xanthobacteraceae bacterium]|nr:hypothetical protein [Xanthobacteraceae bacterium]